MEIFFPSALRMEEGRGGAFPSGNHPILQDPVVNEDGLNPTNYHFSTVNPLQQTDLRKPRSENLGKLKFYDVLFAKPQSMNNKTPLNFKTD